MKKKLTLLLILNIFVHFIFSESLKISDFYLDGVSEVEGHGGNSVLQLSQNEYSSQPETDILLHFDENFIDSTGNYIISEDYNNISVIEKKLGPASAFFLKDRGITYSSNGDSLFTPGRVIGDFTIEFWAYPTIISEDTTLFLWKGINKVDSEFIPQRIKCYIEDRTVLWEFENFFITSDFSQYSIKLKSNSRIIPKQWNHYLLRYESETGLLEFILNGIPEDIKYTTKHQKEDNDIYTPYIGNFSEDEIFIGSKFRGFIDEFRISEKFINEPKLEKFITTGNLYSKVYKVSDQNVNLEKIKISQDLQNETLIKYHYRVSNQPFVETNYNIEWIELITEKISTTGKYIQIKGELLGNGNGDESPILNNIELEWSKITPPPAPGIIKSSSDKNSITVRWSPIQYMDIDGYILYFGEKSGNYIKKIDVGKETSYKFEGLNSNKIYYFSVRSYAKDQKSGYSIETHNRPE